MREIKFRGKEKCSGLWRCGFLLFDGEKYYIIQTIQGTLVKWIVDTNTIGQFTGLHDKNGKEIYEGDILRYPAKDTFEEKNFVSFEVFWHDNDCAANHVGWQMNRYHYHGSVCGTNDISTFLPKYTERMVIIGNIHDTEVIK